MKSETAGAQNNERGSALIIAVLITVIMSLLGISYMMMGQTENIIAENEENAAIALYVAQSGARLAVNWLNDPSSTGYLVPTTGQVDRSLRLLDTDNNPATPRVLADCVVTEHGVARLKGLGERQRAAALIAVAHPRAREELERSLTSS